MKKLLILLAFSVAAGLCAQAPNYPYTTLVVPKVQIPGAAAGSYVSADGTGSNTPIKDSLTDPTGVACTSAAPILRYTTSGVYFGCDSTGHYAAGTFGGGAFVPLSGGTMTGPLIVGSAPTTGIHIAPLGTATNWNLDTTSAATARTSLGAGKFSCQPGLGDGTNAIAAATYPQVTCKNDTGSTITIAGIECFSDNNGTTTLAVSDSASNNLLTGPITCSNSWAAGTQSAHVTLAAGAWLVFSLVSDGTTKQATFDVHGSY